MKINKYDAKANQDITINELPKQDNPNNSDLLVVQSSSLTEATSIQQLRNKILSGGGSYGEDLGQILFFASKTSNPNMHLLDGSLGTKDEFPEFYNFLLNLNSTEQQFWSLDTVAQTFIFKNVDDRFIKATNQTVKTEGSSASFVANHSHTIPNFTYLDSYWTSAQVNNRPSGSRRMLVEINYANESSINVGNPIKSETDNSPASNTPPSVLFFAYVITNNLNRVSTSASIKSDGSVSMDLGYTPTDPLDVTTKKYIDNKFLNYEIPLAFSINDIGKRIPYFKNADQDPTLIALDGTKYLISDYPDFDFETQEGFTNDGVYFWFNDLRLDFKQAIQTQKDNSDSSIFDDGYILFGAGNTSRTFNSKLVYNFLQTPKGQKLLVADGAGKDIDNYGFTILDSVNFTIRQNIYKAPSGQTPNGNERMMLGRPVGQDSLLPFMYLFGEQEQPPVGKNISVTACKLLLKIKPDYMVAKIQQVGSATGTGDLKSDRSVDLIGAGVFNSKQVASMDDLKDTNIMVGNSAKVITTLDSKLNQIDTNIADLQSSVPIFKIAQSRRLIKPNTDIIELSGQSRLFPIDSFIPTNVTGYDSDTFSIETIGGKKVIKEKMENGIQTRHLNIRLSLGHTVTMATKKIELAVFLFRGSQTGLDDNSAIATGSSMLFYDVDTRGQSTNLLSVVVNGINDPFVTEGFFIVLKSLNPTAEKLVFSKGDILINIVNSN